MTVVPGGVTTAAAIAGYPIVTSESKVIWRGSDVLIASTSSNGFLPFQHCPSASTCKPQHILPSTCTSGICHVDASLNNLLMQGAPFGLSFLGTAYSEPSLIGFAYAYEQKTHTRFQRRAYKEAIPRTQLVDVVGL